MQVGIKPLKPNWSETGGAAYLLWFHNSSIVNLLGAAFAALRADMKTIPCAEKLDIMDHSTMSKNTCDDGM